MVSPFGRRGPGDLHGGVDLRAPEGTPVLAVLPGEVVDTWTDGELGRYGNTVLVAHSPDWFSLYAHLRAIAVRPGQRVDAGATVGSVGRSAAQRGAPPGSTPTTKPHVHFELLDSPRRLATPDVGRTDPAPVLQLLGVELDARRITVRPRSAAACDGVATRVVFAPGRLEVQRGTVAPLRPSSTRPPPVGLPSGPEDSLTPWLWLLLAVELGRSKRQN